MTHLLQSEIFLSHNQILKFQHKSVKCQTQCSCLASSVTLALFFCPLSHILAFLKCLNSILQLLHIYYFFAVTLLTKAFSTTAASQCFSLQSPGTGSLGVQAGQHLAALVISQVICIVCLRSCYPCQLIKPTPADFIPTRRKK